HDDGDGSRRRCAVATNGLAPCCTSDATHRTGRRWPTPYSQSAASRSAVETETVHRHARQHARMRYPPWLAETVDWPATRVAQRTPGSSRENRYRDRKKKQPP